MEKRARSLASFFLLCILVSQAGCGSRATPTPEALTVHVDLPQAQAGPSLVARLPAEGQPLALEPVIELTFDREMDRQATAAAWTFTDSDGTPVPGALSWVDGTAFRFSPAERLHSGSVYWGSLSAAAASLTGEALTEEIRLRFRTIVSLAVGQVVPADGTEEVDVYSNITVVFNRPVVALSIEEERGNLPRPLEFSPQVSGSGEWVNTSMYIFQPAAPLTNATTYQVRIAAGLQDAAGNPMEEEYTWSFRTRPVRGEVPEIYPPLLPGRALLDQEIQIAFDQPMDTESVAAALTVEDRGMGQPAILRLIWNDSKDRLTVAPANRYRAAGVYRLTISTDARSATGGALEEEIVYDFSTVPYPRVDSVTPAPDSQETTFRPEFWIQFSSPMDLDSFEGRLRVSPAPAGGIETTYDSFNWTLYASGLQPATDYTVRLLPGTRDIYGNWINQEYTFSFRTADLPPYARLVTPYYPLIYRAGSPQNVFFEYVNLDSARLSLYPLAFDDFKRLVSGEVAYADFRPPVVPMRYWQVDLQARRNSFARLELDLTSRSGDLLPAGYYFIGLNAEPFDYSSPFLNGALLIVATDAITFKTSPTEALAWLTDLESGRPTANTALVFYDRDFDEIGRSETGSDGLAFLDGLADPWYVRVDDGTGRVAFISQDWGSGVSAGQYGMWRSYYASYTPRYAYVYTERPLYRPGQEVYFSGIVRENDDLHYSLPEAPNVYVVIARGGEELFAETRPLSEMGGFSGSFALDENASLGYYTIRVYSNPGDEEQIGGISFDVAEYHKPEFEALPSVTASDVVVGDGYAIDLSANYYSGGPVAGAQVSWYTEASPYYFYPADAEYTRYSFTDWDRDEFWSDPEARTPVIQSSGQDTTDDAGRFHAPLTAALGRSDTSRLIQFYADVTDLSGNIVGTRTSLVVHQAEYYAGIRAAQYVGEIGEEQSYQLVVLDWGANPIAGQAVSVQIVERRWYSVQQQDDNGTVHWVTSVRDIPVTRFDEIVTDAEGRASVSFTPQAGGIYKAVVSVRDGANRIHRASAYLWVSGGEYVPWRQTNDRSFDLVVDQDSYAPGDTAEILIAQPFAGEVYALVTVERGHIYQRQVVRLEGNSSVYRLPITAEMVPVAYVGVTVIAGAEANHPPDFNLAMARLDVDAASRALDVTIETDIAQAGPGDEVTYTIQTRDALGRPIQAELSLALVDKAVLALAPDESPAILDAFYPARSVNVITSVGLIMSADDFNAEYAVTPPEGLASGSGAGKGGPDGIISLREDFRDTAYFEAQILTDESGVARVTVKLPENLTTWRMDVRAASADSLVGQATHELVSSMPLFVQLQTPRFFTAGDTARIGATVFNNLDETLEVRVRLDAEGVELPSDVDQTATVEGGQQAYLTWDVQVAAGATRVDLTATAVSDSYSDSSVPPLGSLEGCGLPVHAFHVSETVGASGLLSDSDSVTEAIRLPEALAYDGARLTVELSPSLAASVSDGLVALQEYPYSCTEQTASRLLANALATRMMQLASRDDPQLRAALEAEVGQGLQNLYGRQLPDGGWGWWNPETSPLASAYVILGLVEARDAGYSVSPVVLSNGIDYLESRLPGLTYAAPAQEYNRQAFMLYVLARAGSPSAYQVTRLYDRRQRLANFGLAYLAQAMHLQNPEDSRIPGLMAELQSAAVLSAAGAHWEESHEDPWNWNTDRRSTAIILDAFVRIDPQNPTTANAVRWLVSRRAASWGSTQETAWTMLALVDWLESSHEFETDYAYAVGLNGNLLREGRAVSTGQDETIRLEVDAGQMAAEGLNYLVVTRGAGAGNLYYTTYLEADLPVSEVAPLDQGIIVMRQYFRMDDPELTRPITSVARGEELRVRVTIIAPESLQYLIVTDPLPAGLEAIDQSLLTSPGIPSAYSYQDFEDAGWGWWFFDHIEKRDEMVVLSADYLPAGAYVYTYYARASTAGTFNVLPTTAYEFYFPDVAGRGAGSVFEVTP